MSTSLCDVTLVPGGVPVKAWTRGVPFDHEAATAGVECRRDEDVLDETPAAYKPIDAVMAAQRDLVEVEHTLRQVVCVKG